jgi:hypothetical protein
VKRALVAVVSGTVGVALGSLGAAGWWLAWILLAAWLGFWIVVSALMPYWAFRLLSERSLSASADPDVKQR